RAVPDPFERQAERRVDRRRGGKAEAMVRQAEVRREVDPPAADGERDLGAAGARAPRKQMHVRRAVEAEAPLVEVSAPVGLEEELAAGEYDGRAPRERRNEGRLLGRDSLDVAEELEVLGSDRGQDAHVRP